MVSRSEAQKKIDQQRKAVRDHIKKWKRDKGTVHEQKALKTIANAQAQIAKWKKRADADVPASMEDDWKPG